MTIEVKSFDDLSSIELYKLLQLRSEVFVLEQHCVYQDIDDKDLKALHVLGKKGEELIAYTRIFNSGDYFAEAAIGRVLVQKKYRKLGLGHQITKASINAIKEHFDASEIRISAQQYLVSFYESHGFKTEGDPYLEEDIPHIAMRMSIKFE